MERATLGWSDRPLPVNWTDGLTLYWDCRLGQFPASTQRRQDWKSVPRMSDVTTAPPASFEVNNVNRLRRRFERGHYDKETGYAILDAAVICTSLIVIDGRPFCTPNRVLARGRSSLLARLLCQPRDPAAGRHDWCA